MRNLASIQLIESVEPIPGADAIESDINPAVEREGIVVRSVSGRLDERGNRLSFKVINPRFLLKYED